MYYKFGKKVYFLIYTRITFVSKYGKVIIKIKMLVSGEYSHIYAQK